MGPSPSRNRVAGVPLGQAFCTSRRVASGIGSSPWGFSDIKHLLSADFVAFSFPYSSRPSLSCLVVRTKFPNRVINVAATPFRMPHIPHTIDQRLFDSPSCLILFGL